MCLCIFNFSCCTLAFFELRDRSLMYSDIYLRNPRIQWVIGEYDNRFFKMTHFSWEKKKKKKPVLSQDSWLLEYTPKNSSNFINQLCLISGALEIYRLETAESNGITQPEFAILRFLFSFFSQLSELLTTAAVNLKS